jgi:hypothetical protein
MWIRRNADFDYIADPDFTTDQYHAHDAGLADQFATRIPVERRRHASRLESIELIARVSQPGYSNLRLPSDVQDSIGWQAQKIDTTGHHGLRCFRRSALAR